MLKQVQHDRRAGVRLFVIQNLFRDLGFRFRIWALEPRPVDGVLYLELGYRCWDLNLRDDFFEKFNQGRDDGSVVRKEEMICALDQDQRFGLIEGLIPLFKKMNGAV